MLGRVLRNCGGLSFTSMTFTRMTIKCNYLVRGGRNKYHRSSNRHCGYYYIFAVIIAELLFEVGI